MNRFGEQPTFRQDPSMQQDYPEDPIGLQQTQGFPEDRMPAPQQPCANNKKGWLGLNFGPFGGGKRKRTKRKRSKRRKSRRS